MSQARTPAVRQQRLPIWVVKSNGTTIEFSDDRAQAHWAFEMSRDTIKEMFRLDLGGRSTLVKKSVNGRQIV